MPQHHVWSLTSLLGRQRLHTCITAPRCGASGFKPSIDTIPFVCLAARRVAAMERAVSTAGYVKLLLPPRQSRGNSHVGLVIINLGALNWANSALGVRGNARDLAGHLIAGQSCHPACRRCLRELYRRMAALRGVSTAAQAFSALNGVGARRISPTKEAPAIERRG